MTSVRQRQWQTLWPIACGAGLTFLFLSWSTSNVVLKQVMRNIIPVTDYPTINIDSSSPGCNQTAFFSTLEKLVHVDIDVAVKLLNNYSQSITDDPHYISPVQVISAAIAKKEGAPWSDMDWSNMHQSCGGSKCLYKSQSDPTMGYLVARKELKIDSLIKGYELEQNLTADYGIPMLSVERPYTAPTISRHMMAVLYAYEHPFDDSRDLVIQKVKLVPTPSVLIGLCKLTDGNKNLDKNHKRIEKLGAAVREGRDVEAFHEQYKKELEKTLKFMHDEKYYYLFKDFQVLVDVTGKWYHIDLDRGGAGSMKSSRRTRMKKEKWHEQLETSMTRVLDWFTEDTSLIDFTKREQEFIEYAAC